MTYTRLSTCRRGGCSRPVSVFPAECEGDLGWCDVHRQEVADVRVRVLSGVRVRPAAWVETRPKGWRW